MTGAGRIAMCAAALTAVVLCHAEPAPVPAFQAQGLPASVASGPPPGIYADTQVLLPATLGPGTVPEYRFSGQESWFPFDRPIYLAAFAGEERRYDLQFRLTDGTAGSAVTYIIDMRPPEPPRFSPSSGDVGSGLAIGITAQGKVLMSLDGGPFETFDATETASFSSPPDATLVVSAAAYAVDTVGNASGLATAVWRLHPDELEPSFPLATVDGDSPRVIEDPARAATAEVIDIVGSARLNLKIPDGAIPCVAVNASDPFGSTASWAQIAGARPAASCVVPFPWGYERQIIVHYGYLLDGTLHAAPVPIVFMPRFPADDASVAPSSPVFPVVRLDASAAFIDWPANPFTTFVSMDGSDFLPIRGPMPVMLTDKPASVRFYSLARNGVRSETGGIELPARAAVPEPRLEGIKNGLAYGTAVVAKPAPGSSIRYELAEGDSAPEAVTSGSPTVPPAGLRFDGRPGEVVRYRLRIVSEAPGASIPAERFVSFSIDRQAPVVPELAYGTRSYSASDSTVSFKPLPSGNIFVSVSEDGQGPFVRYDGPMPMSGSDEGRRRYIIRAFAEDEFGNRSPEMESRRALIDRSSLYADARGRPGASGSPDDPIAYLDDAVEAAEKTGKRFVYVRGTISMRRPVTVRSRLMVAGGFDDDWNESPTSLAVATVRFPSSALASFAFLVDGGALTISSMAISMSAEGAGGIVSARGGSVRIVRTGLMISGGVEMVAVRSAGAPVVIESSSIDLASTVTGRGLDVSAAELELADSSISCGSSVRLFDAVRIADGRASIVGLRLEVAPESTLSGITATRSTVSVERSVVVARGGAASCRLFGANAATLTVSSTYVDLAWKGYAEVFSASNGSSLRIANLTAGIESPRAVLVGSSSSTFGLFNTIAFFTGPADVLIRSDTVPGAGTVSANCLWGFERYLDGAVQSPASSSLELYEIPGHRNLLEEPAKTFFATMKGLRRLSGASACVDTGIVLDWGSSLDLLGTKRVSDRGSRLPDIGAEEL